MDMKGKFQVCVCNKLNSSLERLIGAFSESYILELPLQMITIMKTGPHIFSVVFICSKNWVLGARWKQLRSSDIQKMGTDHNWHKNTSWILFNPAEIESFLKTGADLTVTVLLHVCGSRFHDITLCALKASVLSQALTEWSLDRLCFA